MNLESIAKTICKVRQDSMTQQADLFGFLSVCTAGDAKLGGYLIVDHLGRPLEFHCTEPVKPNRAQQILYGASLDAFVCGERIAHALVTHGSKLPCCLLTDCLSVLDVRNHVELPTAMLAGPQTSPAMDSDRTLTQVEVAGRSYAIKVESSQDQTTLVTALERMDPKLDPSEPFERIHEAVAELRKAA